ncbi:hypothetical protein SAMN05443575_0761 [Jatrophihabitans endophyticus]|uniref:Uncharacterized protein n=1 Tax=Jatrophihabitans endophyticus TaxID=1206085 RepID=A0A1M5E1P8_9ACTN|nr:hypothetical protein [Jatrophihabitans endophyticus]SHF73125.1 hypothetical protein SAMN05443575_0761 [Jatrophihabitans endophyticus]
MSDEFPRHAAQGQPQNDVASRAGEAKDAAADVASSGKQAAADVAETGKQAAGEVVDQAKQHAGDLMGRTRDQVNEQVDAQKSSTVETLRSLGDQLASMTDNTDETGTAVDLAGRARDRARNAADWLESRDTDQILDEVRKLGRERPGAFLLGAVVAGVVTGRLTRGAVAVHTDDSSGTSTTGTSTTGTTTDRQHRAAPTPTPTRAPAPSRSGVDTGPLPRHDALGEYPAGGQVRP